MMHQRCKQRMLLRASDRIRFVPNSGFTGTALLSYKAWDSSTLTPNGPLAFSRLTATAKLSVNTAPIL